jgi:hypothetical protein
VTGYYSYTDDIPDIDEIRRWVAGEPDEELLIEIISRSYDFIKRLPLSRLHEDYSAEGLAFADLAE